jgi:hypothetical protein
VIRSDAISFGAIGWPSPSLLPAPLLLNGALHVLKSSALSIPALQYAPDEGPLPLRHSLSDFLSAFYGAYSARIPIERITTTGGASQNLSVALGALTDPVYTRVVWIVEPTYFLACRIFNDSGLEIRGVGDGGDGAGADVEELRRQMAEVEKIAEREGNNRPVSYCIDLLFDIILRFEIGIRCSGFRCQYKNVADSAVYTQHSLDDDHSFLSRNHIYVFASSLTSPPGLQTLPTHLAHQNLQTHHLRRANLQQPLRRRNVALLP